MAQLGLEGFAQDPGAAEAANVTEEGAGDDEPEIAGTAATSAATGAGEPEPALRRADTDESTPAATGAAAAAGMPALPAYMSFSSVIKPIAARHPAAKRLLV